MRLLGCFLLNRAAAVAIMIATLHIMNQRAIVAQDVTSGTEVTTTSGAQRSTPRGYGAPDWLVEAARADDFRETATQLMTTKPFADAARTSSPLMNQPRALQPGGVLNGKVVFAMAGHGWTYSHDRMTYYTQRGVTHSMVEDFGNLDQMHIFAHMLRNCGATVVPLRAVDNQPNERVIDNADPQAEFFGPWTASASNIHHVGAKAGVPYAFTEGSRVESAVARFRPWIPQEGHYPVYAWARDGADRVSAQLYRVVHAGAVTEIRINHRRVGKGWVWLGTYFFKKGNAGYVEISNACADPYDAGCGKMVVADAVRFGNGKGDALRPVGPSSFLREDEGDCYWIGRSVGATADRRLYASSDDDGNNTVSAPPKTAAYMNRETEGRFFDRLHISFHSNALRGQSRGAVGLYNQTQGQRPDYQERLAELTGAAVNRAMVEEPLFNDLPWGLRPRNSYNGINFGELRRDYLQNEICATIVEVAFHDNKEDSQFLLDPRGRYRLGEATLRGVLQWWNEVEGRAGASDLPPDPVQGLSATAGSSGTIRLRWQHPIAGKHAGGPAADYRISRSADGQAFDGGQRTGYQTTFEMKPVTTSSETYFRIVALNGSGESFPSQPVAVGPQMPASVEIADQETTTPQTSQKSTTRMLLVAGFTSRNASTNEPYGLASASGNSAFNKGTVWRVRWNKLALRPYLSATASSLTHLDVAFDGCDPMMIEAGSVDLKAYTAIVWCAGKQDAETGLFSDAVTGKLKAYVQSGGRLLIHGSVIGAKSERSAARAGISWLASVGINFDGANREWSTIAGGSGEETWEAKLSSMDGGDLPSAMPTTVFKAGRGAQLAARYAASEKPAGLSVAVGRGRITALGFPMENLADESARTALLRDFLRSDTKRRN
jgi:hypothetical protein